jgi:hypothetical protein
MMGENREQEDKKPQSEKAEVSNGKKAKAITRKLPMKSPMD